MSKIKLKATKDAPELVQVGNHIAENKDGFFQTDSREFADSIIADGHATEIVPTKQTKEAKPKTAKPKTAQSSKTVTANLPTPAAEDAAKPVAGNADKLTEGESK